MNKAELLRQWYTPAIAWWVPLLVAVALLVVVAALAINPRRRALFCPVHEARGVYVTLVDGACVLCQFPEVRA